MHDNDLSPKVTQLAQLLLARKISICTAESCTGGMVAAALTAISGSSNWFERGFVTYSNTAKNQLLGVPMDLIQTHGAVSIPVATEMARGAIMHSEACASLAITGVAGPTGGSLEKPVGFVCFGWALKKNGVIQVQSEAVSLLSPEDTLSDQTRSTVRTLAQAYAIDGMLRRLEKDFN
jgi:nicotinamide-nucleotide amidase